MNRFLSEAECSALFTKVAGMAVGGGKTEIQIDSSWSGGMRWAHNQILACGDVRYNDVAIGRTIRGARNRAQTNQLDDASLEGAIRRAERLLTLRPENVEEPLEPLSAEPYQTPKLWYDATFNLDAEARAAAMAALAKPAHEAGMLSAGFISVGAAGRAASATGIRSLYYPSTSAEFTVTVRDPKGTGSGWAGVSGNDWGAIDTHALAATALDKCLRSRNPVGLEPGRYVTILEPQAVCDLVSPLFDGWAMDRYFTEQRMPPLPFSGDARGTTKIGEPIFDERITISADPMDPDIAFVPFNVFTASDKELQVYHAVKWFEDGILMQLAYDRAYALRELGRDQGLPNSGAFKMSGDTATMEDMISSTRRGLLVTRFSDVSVVDRTSLLLSGYTRDGVWLIENGKISKPVKNFRFTDSPLFALGNVEMLGTPKRVYHPNAPVMVPPMKVRDFSFTGVSDAV